MQDKDGFIKHPANRFLSLMSSRLVRTGGHTLGLEDIMEEKKKSMTKDEMIMELMELLKANGRPKQAADV